MACGCAVDSTGGSSCGSASPSVPRRSALTVEVVCGTIDDDAECLPSSRWSSTVALEILSGEVDDVEVELSFEASLLNSLQDLDQGHSQKQH